MKNDNYNKLKHQTLFKTKAKTMFIAVMLISCILLYLFFYKPTQEIGEVIFSTLKQKFAIYFIFISDYSIIIENLVAKERLENIYYFSVTSDRNYLVEKLYLMLGQIPFSLNNQIIKIFDFNKELIFNLKFNNETIAVIQILIITFYICILGALIVQPILTILGFLPIILIFIILFLTIINIIPLIILFWENNIQYINWLVEETFVNRNLYIDSNYFLTNDATKGIERFSDLVVPWLVDNGEIEEWGTEFDIQTQTEQIKERERHLIMNNLSNNMYPNLYKKYKEDGTILAMLDKPIKRISVWLDIINRVAQNREIITDSWENIEEKREISDHENLKIINNIWGNSGLNPGGFKKNLDNISTIKCIIEKKRLTYYEGNDFLDFNLPQKNNIVGDSIAKVGNIQDRKQIVYRNVVNNVSNSTEIENELRKPDFNKNTNYIFEKILQNERSAEYNSKEHLKKYIKTRLNNYWPTKPINIINNINLIPNKILDLKIVKNNEYILAANYNKKNMNLLSFNVENDLNINNIANNWISYQKTKDQDLSREFEFEYELWEDQEILTYEDDEDFYNELDYDLINSNKLGLGNYTYKSEETTPWILNTTKNYSKKPQYIVSANKIGNYILNWFENQEKLNNLINENRNNIIKKINPFESIINKNWIYKDKYLKLYGVNKQQIEAIKIENHDDINFKFSLDIGENIWEDTIYSLEWDNNSKTILEKNIWEINNITESVEDYNLSEKWDHFENNNWFTKTAIMFDLNYKNFKVLNYFLRLLDLFFVKIKQPNIWISYLPKKYLKIKNIEIPIDITIIDMVGFKNKKLKKLINNSLIKNITISRLKNENSLEIWKIEKDITSIWLKINVYIVKIKIKIKNLDYYLSSTFKPFKKITITFNTLLQSILNYLVLEKIKSQFKIYNLILLLNFNKKKQLNMWNIEFSEILKLDHNKYIKIEEVWLEYIEVVFFNRPIIDFPKFKNRINEIEKISNYLAKKTNYSNFYNKDIFYENTRFFNEFGAFNSFLEIRFLLNIFKEQSIMARIIGIFDTATNNFFWKYSVNLKNIFEDNNWVNIGDVLINEIEIIKTIQNLQPCEIRYDNEFIYYSKYKEIKYEEIVKKIKENNLELNDWEILAEYYSYYLNQIFLTGFIGSIVESIYKYWYYYIIIRINQLLIHILTVEILIHKVQNDLEKLTYINNFESILDENKTNNNSISYKMIDQKIKKESKLLVLFTYFGLPLVDDFLFSKWDFIRIWKVQNIVDSIIYTNLRKSEIINKLLNLTINSEDIQYYKYILKFDEYKDITNIYILFCSILETWDWLDILQYIKTNFFLKNFKQNRYLLVIPNQHTIKIGFNFKTIFRELNIINFNINNEKINIIEKKKLPRYFKNIWKLY